MNLNHFADLAIVPVAEHTDKSHPYSDGWRIIRSIEPEGPNCRVLLGRLNLKYLCYNIYYEPPPIPIRTMDWHFVHEDYDGAEDAGDHRCGDARTLAACFDEIDALEND